MFHDALVNNFENRGYGHEIFLCTFFIFTIVLMMSFLIACVLGT